MSNYVKLCHTYFNLPNPLFHFYLIRLFARKTQLASACMSRLMRRARTNHADIFAHDRTTLAFASERSSFVLGKEFAKGQRRNAAPPTIRHEFAATGTPLQGSAHIYPLAYALNSPRVFVYASDSRPSSVRIPVDQPGRTSR